jgi:ABC-type Fe3+/spermidine/putrescine transport system ATPase subunit
MSLQVTGLKIEWSGFSRQWDFELNGNERLALAGPSGSGKTTLLRALAGLPVGLGGAWSGQILLNGRDLTRLPPEDRRIGMVFQDPLLFPGLSVAENVSFGLRFRGVISSERDARARAALERVGLGHRAKDSIQGLSGGEKQRISFLRAVMPQPELLLLDEPFSALDPVMRQTLQSDLLQWHREAKVPVVLVTHDPSEAEKLSTRRLALE